VAETLRAALNAQDDVSAEPQRAEMPDTAQLTCARTGIDVPVASIRPQMDGMHIEVFNQLPATTEVWVQAEDEDGGDMVWDSGPIAVQHGRHEIVQPVPPGPLTVTPGAIARTNCTPTNTFQFIGTGGTGPYSAVVLSSTSVTSPVVNPQNNITPGQGVSVSGISSPSTTVVQLIDNSTPRQTATVSIDCSGTTPPPPPAALVVTPQTQGNASTSCVGQTYTFVISGGTGPYSVFFQSPKPGATITPASVTSSGQSFVVAGLPLGPPSGANNITIVDSGSPALVTTASVVCL